MKFVYKGNNKLGKNTSIMSRPVGDTCPSDCHFLDNGCYAQQTEKQYKKARSAAFANIQTNAREMREFLVKSFRTNKAVRLMERGDWVKPDSQTAENPQGELDVDFYTSFVLAIQSIVVAERPKVWFYTHLYDTRLANLSQLNGVFAYASVNSDSDYSRAKTAGFKRFAFGANIKKPHYNAKVRVAIPPRIKVEFDGDIFEKTLVCPEQRLGRKKITCDKCKWCFSEHGGNVAFLSH